MDRVAAEELVEVGNRHADAHRVHEAESCYRAAIQADRSWSVPWYDLGLLCKYQGRWLESFECNHEAAALAPDDVAAWWNLGIAATALGEWADARRAWQACGLVVPPGEGPLDLNYGWVPVRLDPQGAGEVVWARRLDLTRARILSVPLPTSSFRWHDIVLCDGAPEGYRQLRDETVPVFNVLARLEPSPYRTFVVELGTNNPDAIEALSRVADESGGAAEHWASSTNHLCRQCSLGIPHTHVEQSRNPAHLHCGVAARDRSHLERILNRWFTASPAADLVRWRPAPGGGGA